MKKIQFIWLFLFGVVFSSAFSNKKPIDPKKEKKIFDIIYNQLKSRHLIDKKIDDNFSKKVFRTYLENIDRYKIFLLQSDINEFKKFEKQLDDQIKNNDLTFFYLTYDRIKIRMNEGKQIYTNLIKNKFDLYKIEDDYIEENLDFQKTKSNQINQWKKFIKAEIFTRTTATIVNENQTTQLNQKLFEVQFHESLQLYTDNFSERIEVTTMNIDNFSREMFFEEYVNAFIEQYDIHSKYMIPRTRDEYLIKQTGKIEGIGILTQNKDNFVQIRSMSVGGPA